LTTKNNIITLIAKKGGLMKYLLTLMLMIPMACSACEECDKADPAMVYFSDLSEIYIVDPEMDVIITPHTIVFTKKVQTNEFGFYYLTTDVKKVIGRNHGDLQQVAICHDCGSIKLKDDAIEKGKYRPNAWINPRAHHPHGGPGDGGCVGHTIERGTNGPAYNMAIEKRRPKSDKQHYPSHGPKVRYPHGGPGGYNYHKIEPGANGPGRCR
jgi:hypothetical protein